MKQYLDLLDRILKEGKPRKDRTGTGTIGVFGHKMTFKMQEGFPLLTTKKLHLKSITYELLWFLQGGTNIKYLNEHGVTIWDEWADKDGNLGPIYGYQWRNWTRLVPSKFPDPAPYQVEKTDQIANLIKMLQTNPDNRRMMVSAWNVGDLPDMLFPPCHYGFQVSTFEMTAKERWNWYTNGAHGHAVKCIGLVIYDTEEQNQHVHQWLDQWAPFVPKRTISLAWNQRSVDTFLGLPFNIASYALLLQMIAQVVNMVPDELTCFLGDTHLYLNHLDQARLQLTREPYPLPTMSLNPAVKNIDDFKYEDFTLSNYTAHPHIKGDISV